MSYILIKRPVRTDQDAVTASVSGSNTSESLCVFIYSTPGTFLGGGCILRFSSALLGAVLTPASVSASLSLVIEVIPPLFPKLSRSLHRSVNRTLEEAGRGLTCQGSPAEQQRRLVVMTQATAENTRSAFQSQLQTLRLPVKVTNLRTGSSYSIQSSFIKIGSLHVCCVT